MVVETNLYFTKESAQRFLEAVSASFPAYYKKHTGSEFSVSKHIRSVKYWKETLGNGLAGKGPMKLPRILGDASLLYDLDSFTRSSGQQEKSYRVNYLRFKGIFTNLLPADQRDPTLFGQLKDEPSRRGRPTIQTLKAQLTARNKFERLQEHQDNRAALLLTSQWTVYCWEEHPIPARNTQGGLKANIEYGVESSILLFIEQKAHLYFPTESGVNVYTGQYTFTASTYLLEIGPLTINGHSRNLRLLADIGETGHLPDLMTGVFYNSRKDSTLACGSALFVKRQPNQHLTLEEIYNGQLIQFHVKSQGLPDVIRHFFRNRGQNFIQLPKSGYSIEELGLVLDKFAMSKKYTQSIDFKYDVFISIPLTSPGQEEAYTVNRQMAMTLRSVLSSEYNMATDRFYLACNAYETLTHYRYKDSADLFEETRQNLIDSCYYVMLYPSLYHNSRISSAVAELAMAVGLGKVAILFCSQEVRQYLPKNITDSKRVKIYTLVHTNPNTIKSQLEGIIQSNKYQLFGNAHNSNS